MCACLCRILSWKRIISENKALNSLMNPFEKEDRNHSQGLHCIPVEHQRAECAGSFSLGNPLGNLFWQEGKKLLCCSRAAKLATEGLSCTELLAKSRKYCTAIVMPGTGICSWPLACSGLAHTFLLIISNWLWTVMLSAQGTCHCC